MNWHAIRTMTDREFDVVQSIRKLDYRAECPVAIERRSRKRGGALVYTEIARPMFQGYVLADIDRAGLGALREDRNVYWPLPSWLAPRQIPERQVHAALSLSGIKLGDWKALQKFKAGDIIRRKGDRSGLAFEVTEATAELVVALFEALGKQHRIEFMPEMVEAAE